MRRVIVIFYLITQISGCIGVGFSRPVYSSYDMPKKLTRLSENNEIKDGKVIVNYKREWCGPVIGIVIPIPIMLPVCESFKELTYKEGSVIHVADKIVTGRMYACGPFMCALNIGHGYEDYGFICGSVSL